MMRTEPDPDGGRPRGNMRLLVACLIAVIVGRVIAVIVIAGNDNGSSPSSSSTESISTETSSESTQTTSTEPTTSTTEKTTTEKTEATEEIEEVEEPEGSEEPAEGEEGDDPDDEEDQDRQGARQAVLLVPALEGHGVDHRDEDVGVAHHDRCPHEVGATARQHVDQVEVVEVERCCC